MGGLKLPNTDAGKDAANSKFGIRSRVVTAVVGAAILILGCGGWAVSAKLSGAIIAQGQIVVRQQVKLVQHRDGGIVSAILVENGSAVEAGDVLVRLDDTQAKAELAIVRGQISELQGRRARLTAEREGADTLVFADGFETDPMTRDIARGERRLFAQNQARQEGKREQLALQVEQYEDQVRGLEAQQTSNEAERAIVAADLERFRKLVKKGIVGAVKLGELERDLSKVEGMKGEIASNIARVKGQISEARLKIIEFDQEARTDAQRELRDVEARLSEQQERAIALRDRLSRMELRAPIAGYVNDLSIHTVDGVIAAGESVMSIVPVDDDLIVEARLAPSDIDQIHVGQHTRLRFSAFNQRTTPEVDGTVEVIAAAATMDPVTKSPYYLSSIVIADGIGALGEKNLVPGMPVEVFITTEERSPMSYLVKPFTDQMMRAFREE